MSNDDVRENVRPRPEGCEDLEILGEAGRPLGNTVGTIIWGSRCEWGVSA